MLSEENIKIAVFFRAARAALGWTQVELAKELDVAKTIIARIETLETSAKGDLVAKALRIFKNYGIVLDPFFEDSITFRIEPEALNELRRKLTDTGKRRSDRRKAKRDYDF